jgi:hypothetical protein
MVNDFMTQHLQASDTNFAAKLQISVSVILLLATDL